MATSQTLVPPYASFGVFKSTIDTLSDSVVPSGPLDRRVLDGLSGADYGSLMSALKFLGLIDDERKATESYRRLIQSSKDRDKFKAALADVVSAKYKPITGNVDLKHGTLAQLEKAFKDADVAAGQMLTKTIRFYVKALQESGIDVSPHITKARKPSGGKKPNGTRKKTLRTPTPSNLPDDTIPSGFARLPIPGVADAYIQYPTNLTDANCDLFDAMIGVLRTYAKGRAGKEKKP